MSKDLADDIRAKAKSVLLLAQGRRDHCRNPAVILRYRGVPETLASMRGTGDDAFVAALYLARLAKLVELDPDIADIVRAK